MEQLFRMYNIKQLISDMAAHKAKRDLFMFRINDVSFEVVITIDRVPFEILFGVVGHTLAFTLKMYPGYNVELPNWETYKQLCHILKLSNQQGFNSFSFLKCVNDSVPSCYSGKQIQPHRVARLINNDITRKEKVDEFEKIYFVGWLHHDNDNRNARNLEKTRLILGEEAYEFCKDNNISSKWSKEPKDEKKYYDPHEHMKRI